jgi:predicted RNA-binding protein with RPS1 domain
MTFIKVNDIWYYLKEEQEVKAKVIEIDWMSKMRKMRLI